MKKQVIALLAFSMLLTACTPKQVAEQINAERQAQAPVVCPEPAPAAKPAPAPKCPELPTPPLAAVQLTDLFPFAENRIDRDMEERISEAEDKNIDITSHPLWTIIQNIEMETIYSGDVKITGNPVMGIGYVEDLRPQIELSTESKDKIPLRLRKFNVFNVAKYDSDLRKAKLLSNEEFYRLFANFGRNSNRGYATLQVKGLSVGMEGTPTLIISQQNQ